MSDRIIVIGAGISGLSAAWKLARGGIKADILEASGMVGGLSGTVREDGYSLDLGPHSFFSEDIGIVDTVLKLFDGKLKPMPRKVKFYYKGRFLDYPLTAHNVLFQMGLASGTRAALSFIKSRVSPKKRPFAKEEDESVEDWAVSNFGEHLYRTFFRPYTEQFWKVPCAELSSRSIPTHTRMNFLNTCRVLLHKRATKDGSSLIEREALPTYYPNTGFGEIAERIARIITKSGGNIRLGCEAVEINKIQDGRIRVSYKQDGQLKNIEGPHVISTIPLNLLIGMLKPLPPEEILESSEKLDYRSLVVLGMVTEKQDILNAGYVYMLDRPYNRIFEMNKFSLNTSPGQDNILAAEIVCLRESAVWEAGKEELFEMCAGSLATGGFILPGDVKRLLLIKTPYAYPIYHKNYAGHLKRLIEYVGCYKDITTLGRAGEFMYMDADECVGRAFDLAGRILADRQKEDKEVKELEGAIL